MLSSFFRCWLIMLRLMTTSLGKSIGIASKRQKLFRQFQDQFEAFFLKKMNLSLGKTYLTETTKFP